ncbi:MAG: DUF2384 domain-containing protein [Gammaproteobacteria bacterium]|nr:DUF2384 domain-containing protein [Gammaproteobacteria bacterium]
MGKMSDMNQEDQLALTQAVMAILDEWGLSANAQMLVLNLPKGTPSRALRKFREHTAFPEDPEVMQRLEQIVGIADALRTSYPHNPAMGTMWLQQRNNRFEDRAPLSVIIEGGLEGLVEVRMHLDCSYDWHLDKQK